MARFKSMLKNMPEDPQAQAELSKALANELAAHWSHRFINQRIKGRAEGRIDADSVTAAKRLSQQGRIWAVVSALDAGLGLPIEEEPFSTPGRWAWFDREPSDVSDWLTDRLEAAFHAGAVNLPQLQQLGELVFATGYSATKSVMGVPKAGQLPAVSTLMRSWLGCASEVAPGDWRPLGDRDAGAAASITQYISAVRDGVNAARASSMQLEDSIGVPGLLGLCFPALLWVCGDRQVFLPAESDVDAWMARLPFDDARLPQEALKEFDGALIQWPQPLRLPGLGVLTGVQIGRFQAQAEDGSITEQLTILPLIDFEDGFEARMGVAYCSPMGFPIDIAWGALRAQIDAFWNKVAGSFPQEQAEGSLSAWLTGAKASHLLAARFIFGFGELNREWNDTVVYVDAHGRLSRVRKAKGPDLKQAMAVRSIRISAAGGVAVPG